MLLSASCGDSDESGGGGPGAGQATSTAVTSGTSARAVPVVVATTSIWADIVSNVACGGLATVETLIPVGADSHAFEPSLADRAAMEGAALVVSNGLALEGSLDDTLEAVERAGTPVLRMADHIDTIPFGDDGHEGDDHEGGDDGHEDDVHDDGHEDDGHEDDGHQGHEHEGDDPHVWFDPVRVSGALDELAEHLIRDAGLQAAAVDNCLTAYRSELADLDKEIAALVDEVPPSSRKLVTNHEALGYFADRYGFEVIGTIIPAHSTLAVANPAQLEELARLIEAAGIRALFAESQHSTSDADALARRVGDVTVVTLYTETLGPPGSGADSYVGVMRANAQMIATALG